MAWTTTNPVAVGNITKKSQYDTLWDNAEWLHTNVLGLTSGADTSIDVTFQGGVTHGVGTDDTYLKFEGAATAADGASLALYGEEHANTGLAVFYIGGDGIAESGGAFAVINQANTGNEQLFGVTYQYVTFGEQVGGTPVILRHHDAAGYLALYGGDAGATGAQLVLQGDDYTGIGSGGNITLRTGSTDNVLFENSSGNSRFKFDLDATDPTVYVENGSGTPDGLVIDATDMVVQDTSNSATFNVDPYYTTATTRMTTNLAILDMSVGQDTIALPIWDTAPTTVMDGSTFIYENGTTRELHIRLSGAWYKTALTAV